MVGVVVFFVLVLVLRDAGVDEEEENELMEDATETSCVLNNYVLLPVTKGGSVDFGFDFVVFSSCTPSTLTTLMKT